MSMDFTGYAQAGASAFGAYMSYKGQKEANEANLRIATENREWQERMSSTAHQREVVDLRAAGLNPILSAFGNGATSPQGSTAVMQNENDEAAVMAASTAKMLSEVRLNKEMAKTEKTKQKLNESAESVNKGWLGIPGFGKISMQGMQDTWKAAGRSEMPGTINWFKKQIQNKRSEQS